MIFKAGWTARSGPRIRYLDNAPADPVGLPVLFSPGLSDTADEYGGMLEFFAPRRLLVVEVRGRGGSEAPPSGYTAADHAADLRAVLDEEGIQRFHLVTFSRGTTWGLDLALSCPERVASLAIADYRAMEVRLSPSLVESQWQTTFRGRPMSDRMPRHVFDQLAAHSTPRELWDGLGSLPCPLLVARPGGRGGILTDEDIARYRDVRPDVEVVVVPEAPHDVFRPDRLFFPRAVTAFVQRAEH
ncbi:alpha/beta fold hydrolase [Actinomadura craniellae]|uniref:alpha/beta fold hydrolase n=1 Tax=Actinomadura craniellae TaxID=2231787 RepID=UPI0013143195|nr:alpha/beta hydrolase [Actinomadura craniellae]